MLEEGTDLPSEFDAIILGTGLKEGIVSALLSVHGRRVLHLDRNSFYGGDCASLTLPQLFEHFGEKLPEKHSFGAPNEWNIDLIAKFILSDGDLTKMLRHANCLQYLEFGRVSGSFVYTNKQIHRVPTTTKQALESKLMGLLEKKRMASLFTDIGNYVDNPAADSPLKKNGRDPRVTTMNDYFDAYKLAQSTRDFIGHAMALYLDDSYLTQPAYPTFCRINLYAESVNRFGQSPFIYPLYGLGDLPQAFSRVAAVWGGTYMLNKPVDEVLFEGSATDAKVVGVRCGKDIFRAPILVGDPSYFPNLVRNVGRIGRYICIMTGPIPVCESLSDEELDRNGSRIVQTAHQVIIPANQAPGRKSDIYVSTQGYNHRTTPKNYVLGYVSGLIEGSKDDNRSELEAGLDILKTAGIKKSFYKEYNLYAPKPEAATMNIFISESYDATSHFESTVADAIQMYETITREKLDLSTQVQRPTPQAVEE